MHTGTSGMRHRIIILRGAGWNLLRLKKKGVYECAGSGKGDDTAAVRSPMNVDLSTDGVPFPCCQYELKETVRPIDTRRCISHYKNFYHYERQCTHRWSTRIGTIGGAMQVTLLNIWHNDFIRTIGFAALGATVSFFVSLLEMDGETGRGQANKGRTEQAE